VLQAALWYGTAPGEWLQGVQSIWPAGVLLVRGLQRDLTVAAPHSWPRDDSRICFRRVGAREFHFERRGDFASIFADCGLGSAPEAVLVVRADFADEQQELACALSRTVRRAHAEPDREH